MSEPIRPPLSEGQKEQVKLTATYFNGVAIGLILVGTISLPTSIVLSIGSVGSIVTAALVAMACFGASTYIHRVAKQKLKELDR